MEISLYCQQTSNVLFLDCSRLAIVIKEAAAHNPDPG